MANLTVSEAARLVGKNRSTIQRYIQSGKLSASKDNNGVCVIDTAELVRVFGEFSASEADNNAKMEAEQDNQPALMAIIEMLKDQLKVAQARENRLLAMLEHEQETRRQLEQRLLPPGNEAGTPEKPKKGFWARIFSR